MTIAKFCQMMHVEVSDNVLLAASYLQSKGLKFCVDFGTDNAWQIAEEIYEQEAA